MKYLLSGSFLYEMILGEPERRSLIEEKLKELVQDNQKLIATSLSIFSLLEREFLDINKTVILNQFDIFLDDVIPVVWHHIRTGIALQNQYKVNSLQSVEIAVAMEAGATLLDNTEDLKIQKLVVITSF